ncbi:MAG: alpha/beta hydrolase [Saprospiraceae bacterium]|nr:alpha/beta hydrolase [Saprospiraceae bacterium]
MASFSYLLVKLVLKAKGIKKIFSETPINYKKLRKDDFFVPTKSMVRGLNSHSFRISESTVTEIFTPNLRASKTKLIIYCPGGAFICGPTKIAWQNIAYLVKKTKNKAWLINYPKAPEYDIKTISKNIDEIYAKALKKFDPSNIILLGGSAGGNLIITLTQRLIKNKLPCPSKLIAVCPVIDASLTNPDIDSIEKKDLMLSKKGLLSANKMAAKKLDLTDPEISPLYGNFNNFPPTFLFAAENDILTPDILKIANKINHANARVTIIEGPSMPHVWPFIPVMKEAKEALKQIQNLLVSEPNNHKI